MNDIIHVTKLYNAYSVSREALDDWELIYCTQGEGTLVFDGLHLPFRAGNAVAIPPGLTRTCLSPTGFEAISIHMCAPGFSAREPIVACDDSAHNMRNVFTAIAYHYQSPDSSRSSFLGAYGYLVCCYISASLRASHPRPSVVEDIKRDILQHFRDCDYRLETYLRSLPFSYDYIRKLFQRETGFTPHRFLNDVRLEQSARSLVDVTGSSVADISRSCGFREPLYFSRMFKKQFGVAPSVYREQHILASKEVFGKAFDSDDVP